ncbi:MAG: TolC family protein, partial [Aureibaculum sp.]
MMNYIKYILLIFTVSAGLQAQEKMITKSEAVQLALENNYGIKISNNNLKIAENNKGIMNTGFLPTLTGNAGTTYNLDNT